MLSSPLSSTNKEPYLIYRLSGQLYAVPIKNVCEVMLRSSCMSVSQVSEYVVAIVNYNGKIIPIIDILKRLSLPQAEDVSVLQYVIVFQVDSDFGPKVFGILIDKVHSVGEYLSSDIKEIDVFQSDSTLSSYIMGVIDFSGEYVLVVNPSKFISNEDFSQISKIVSEKKWIVNLSNND